MIEQSYIHPNADNILDDTKTILCSSDLGKKHWDDNKAKITILKGYLPQAFVHKTEAIYLRVPALQQKGRIEQAFDLFGAFIELRMNESKPAPIENLNNDDVVASQHMRNVEIMLKVFEIADSLDNAGYKAVKELRLMGIGKIYQAWKTGANLDECANIYWNMGQTKEEDNNDA